MWRIISSLLIVFALAGLAHRPRDAGSQEAIYATFRLVEYAADAYRLDVLLQGDIVTYGVYAYVRGVGSDQAVVATLAESDEHEVSMALQPELLGMRAANPGCYQVRFEVRPIDSAKDATFAPSNLTTYACVDDRGVTTFPAFDSEQAPPPAPPSDVRLVRTEDDTWEIHWRNNSPDVIANDPGIILTDQPWTYDGSANQLGAIEIPMVPGDATSAGGINSFFMPALVESPAPSEPVCGYALVLVFAIGFEGTPGLPGNTTVPACFTAERIDFPTTGAPLPGDSRRPGLRWTAAGVLAAALSIAFGALHRRRG